MKVKLLNHKIILNVEAMNQQTKVITVKIFGTLCKFQEHEYEIVEEK